MKEPRYFNFAGPALGKAIWSCTQTSGFASLILSSTFPGFSNKFRCRMSLLQIISVRPAFDILSDLLVVGMSIDPRYLVTF